MKEPNIIYDCSNNDSRIPVSYIIVNNESLGGGGFGEVYKVQRVINGEKEKEKENQIFALKKIKKEGIVNDKDKHYRVLSEIKIHRTLKNKYICKYEHSFEDNQAIYIIMEFCERKSLDDFLKTRKYFTEYETRYYMFQVLQGLKYLRRKKVIHRDLTLGNLFLKDYKTVKIGDFGLSYIETENEEKSGLMCGTQGYFTPEAVQTRYSYKTDIFCFGVCIYHMMVGTPLFKDAAMSFDMIKKGDIAYDEKTRFSKQCKDLFEQIFVFENKRIDLDDISAHPFFNEGKGLIGVDFPNYFDEKMNKKDFEEKIKNLEKNVIMTDVSPFPRKNDNNNLFSGKKDSEYSSNSKNDNEIYKKGMNINDKKEYNLKDAINSLALNNKIRALDNSNIKDKYISNNMSNDKNNLKNNNINNTIDSNINNKELFPPKEQSPKFEHKVSDKKLPLLILNELKKKEKEQKKTENESKPKKIIEKLDLDNIINEDEEEREENDGRDIRDDNIDNDNNIKNNIFKEVDTLKPKESNKDEEEVKNNIINNIKGNILFQNIYIKKILEEDYKFGIAYELNNGDFGILFNDDSIMTKFSQYKNVIYYRNNSGSLTKIILPLKSGKEMEFEDKINLFCFIIEEEKKKEYRKKYLNNREENSKNDNFSENIIIQENKLDTITKQDIYLIKYKKNCYAHFFILSNDDIQIKYNDGINVIFCCSLKNKKIIYIDINGRKTEFELEQNKDFSKFFCKDEKINNRIKYAIKEIIK